MNDIQKPLIKQGWLRALLFLLPWLAFTLLFTLLGSFIIADVLQMERVPMGDNVQSLVKYGVLLTGTLTVTWVWRKLVDRQNLWSIGFKWNEFKAEALMGLLSGILIISVGTLLLAGFSLVNFSGLEFEPRALAIEIVLMFMISLLEEVVIRGYLLNNLMQSFNKWFALAVTSIFFAIMHADNPGITWLAIANIVLAGMLLGVNYIYTKNLWFGIALHFAWNFMQGPVYGYEVSGVSVTTLFQQSVQGPEYITGGAFGFEGSVVCLVLLVLAFVFYARIFNGRYLNRNRDQ